MATNEVFLAFEQVDEAHLFRLWLADQGRELFAVWAATQQLEDPPPGLAPAPRK